MLIEKGEGGENHFIGLRPCFFDVDGPVQVYAQSAPLPHGVEGISFVPSYKISLFIEEFSFSGQFLVSRWALFDFAPQERAIIQWAEAYADAVFFCRHSLKSSVGGVCPCFVFGD